MNKTKIEWCDYTANPVRGLCPHYGTARCGTYCYAEKIRRRFKKPSILSFHPEVFGAIRGWKKPATVFIGSMIDLFAKEIPAVWTQVIIDAVAANPKITALFLTKNPKRYTEFQFPDNAWLGATVTSEIQAVRARDVELDFLSVEPLMGSIISPRQWIKFAGEKHVIVGAQTGQGAVPPDRVELESILSAAYAVFLKDNILKHFPDLNKPEYRRLAWEVNK